MHENGSPPAPIRFRRGACCRLTMAHNEGVSDVSAVQTTPPFEVHLAADIQNVHKMFVDHIALTPFASHTLCLLAEVLTIPGEPGSARLLFHSCPSPQEAENVFLLGF